MSKLGDELVEPARTLEETCGNVTNALTADDWSDDVALLLARTHTRDPDLVASWDLPSDPAIVTSARKTAARQLSEWGLDELALTSLSANWSPTQSGTARSRFGCA